MQEENIQDFITDNGDGTVTVTLKDGSGIVMREPSYGDQRVARKGGGDEEDRAFRLLCNLLGKSPDEVDKMKLADAVRLHKVAASFLS